MKNKLNGYLNAITLSNLHPCTPNYIMYMDCKCTYVLHSKVAVYFLCVVLR